MNTIPIVFTPDNNFAMPCGVTITSLLMNSKADTFYSIYIIYNANNLSVENLNLLEEVTRNYSNSSFHSIDVGARFINIPEYQRFPMEAFFRILIPQLITEYDKVIYVDADMIIQQDLYALFSSALQNNEIVAAVHDLSIVEGLFFTESLVPSKSASTVYDYVNAGFLIMNLELMRTESIKNQFDSYLHKDVLFNDQDIINMVCKNSIQYLPIHCNFQVLHFVNYYWENIQKDNLPTFKDMFSGGTLHYTGPYKPWNAIDCLCADTWWHYYKQSIFYDDVFYFKHQQALHEALRRDIKKAGFRSIVVALLSLLKKTVMLKSVKR